MVEAATVTASLTIAIVTTAVEAALAPLVVPLLVEGELAVASAVARTRILLRYVSDRHFLVLALS